MRARVIFESRSGHTGTAADAVVAALQAKGVDASAARLSAAGATDLTGVDLLVFGTWVEGFVIAGVGPAKAARQWLERLPSMSGTRAAVFCTYGVSPRGTLATLRTALEAKGAVVVGEASFSRRKPTTGAEAFVDAVLGALAQ